VGEVEKKTGVVQSCYPLAKALRMYSIRKRLYLNWAKRENENVKGKERMPLSTGNLVPKAHCTVIGEKTTRKGVLQRAIERGGKLLSHLLGEGEEKPDKGVADDISEANVPFKSM